MPLTAFPELKTFLYLLKENALAFQHRDKPDPPRDKQISKRRACEFAKRKTAHARVRNSGGMAAHRRWSSAFSCRKEKPSQILHQRRVREEQIPTG